MPPPRYFTLHASFTFRPITAGRPAQSKTTAMAAIDRSAFCDATGQDDADFEPWVVSYLKLAVVCMAAWRLAALVVRLPGKFIPRGTGLLIAGLLASIAGMIFDRVAKVDVMMNARTGQHNRLNIYFPVRAASTPCCCESRRTRHLGTRAHASKPAPRRRSQINYMCMSFIAYATGAQLVMKNFRGLGKRIIVSALCVSSSVLIVVGLFTYVSLKSGRGERGGARLSPQVQFV